MPNAINIALIPLLPFAGFLLLGLFGKKFFGKTAGLIGTALLLVSCLLAFQTGIRLFLCVRKSERCLPAICANAICMAAVFQDPLHLYGTDD